MWGGVRARGWGGLDQMLDEGCGGAALASVLVLSTKLGPGLNTIKSLSSLLIFAQEKIRFQFETFNPSMMRY